MRPLPLIGVIKRYLHQIDWCELHLCVTRCCKSIERCPTFLSFGVCKLFVKKFH